MSWPRRLWNAIRSGRVSDDIDRELAFHLAERADDLRAQGLSEREARRRARLQLGNVLLHRDRTRDVDIVLWADAAIRHLRYAVRRLVRSPGFTSTVLLTLALGIGANSAVFSALNAVLLRPLPYPDADRLVRITQTQARTAETNIAPVRLEDWQRLSTAFDAMTGYYVEDVTDTAGDVPALVRRAFVAPRFVEVWGVPPAIGRGFRSSEHRAGGDTVRRTSTVLISDRYWRVRFGGDPHVLGRTVRLGTGSSEVIGVMPASFVFPDRAVDLWFPVAMSPRLQEVRTATWYVGIGRLKRGVTPEQAHANLAAVQASLAGQFPETDRDLGIQVVPLKDAAVVGARHSLWLLFCAVTVLLLITCTNVAALLLSRASDRQREIGVHLALGATRVSVAAQPLTEAALLALGGGAAGLVVAAAAAAGLRTLLPDLPRADEISLDARILSYTLLIVIVVTLLCGVLPAMRARSRTDRIQHDAGRGQISGRHAWQWLMVGAQVALSVALLAGAGLFVRSFQALWRVDAGFDASSVLAFRVTGGWAETSDYGRLVQRVDRMLGTLRGVPGVEHAATAVFLPGVPSQNASRYGLSNTEADDHRMVAETRFVSPEYFSTVRIPLIEGRLCRHQPLGAPRDLMINQAFAARYLSDRTTALGWELSADTARAGRIVGVVGNAREPGLDRAPAPTVYPCFNAPNPTPHVLLRTSGDPAALAQTVRLKMKEIEPLRAVYEIAPLDERLGRAFAQNEMRAVVLSVFAGLALLLACVGVYGTLSYAVSVRRREIGLRLALGAGRTGVVRQFLGSALRIVSVGCLCGLALSLALGRVVSSMLFGISPSDVRTLSGVIALVLAVSATAALIPSVRAALVEPMRVLRDE